LRCKPGRIEPPRFQEFSLEVDPESTVLDALEDIRLKQDSTLMYRHSCKIKDLNAQTITLAPLDEFEVCGDLVVDISPFFNDISDDWSYLKKSEYGATDQEPEGIRSFNRFENCIECGACNAACPVTVKNMGFVGPAVLAALSNELMKSPHNATELLSIAGNTRGVHLCERAFNCSRVCPTRVHPARHISALRKLIEKAAHKK
jgi:succinate dehydrogenase / fumarate reductase iron-sulfur subunit